MPPTPKPSPAASAELGRRIRAARDRRGLTVGEVARAVGVIHSQPGRWESGQATPSLGSLLAVGRVLRTDPGLLVRGLHRL